MTSQAAVPYTLGYGLDGHAYEIDLTDAHAHQFRDLPAPTSSGRPYTRIDLDPQNHQCRSARPPSRD